MENTQTPIDQKQRSLFEKILIVVVLITVILFVIVMLDIANEKRKIRDRSNDLMEIQNEMIETMSETNGTEDLPVVIDPFVNPDVDVLAVPEITNTSTDATEIENDLEMLNFEDLDYGL